MAEMAGDIHENLEKVQPVVSNRGRRNSTGSLGLEIGESKVLSRYLGVPMGSCHDMCKHGFEHDSPTKSKIPRPTRYGSTLGKIPDRKKIQSSTKTGQVNGQETKRTPAVINHHSDCKLKHSEENESSLSRRRQRRYSDIFIPGMSSKLQESLLGGSNSRRNNCIMEKDGGSSELSKKKSIGPAPVSLSPKSSVKKVLSTASNNNSPRKVSQLISRMSNTPSKAGQNSQENVPKKTFHLRESNTKSHSTGLSQENSNAKESSSDKDSPKRGKTVTSPLGSPSSPLSSSGGSSRNISTTQSSISSSSLKLSSTSANESLNSDATAASTGQTVTTSPRQNIKPQRPGQIGSENEDCSPKFLEFKKGKTIDVQPEKTSPRRQKYRQVTLLDKSESENNDLSGKSLRRSIADGHSDTAKEEGVKVNLRSHATEDSKDLPDLFNNVIEVTAGKLVETRRSKVKALVGAFETIISLQDKKPSPAIRRS